MTPLRFGTEPTPVGTAVIAVGDAGLLALEFDEAPPEHTLEPVMQSRGAVAVHDPTAVEHIAAQLREYFAGERTSFELELAPEGTDFQKRVWKALEDIPYGETRSYGQLAAAIGSPGAARAVGLANGRNPIGIVVPCHRVIGADGSLTGYGGGLDRKQVLLELERSLREPTLALHAVG